LKKRLFAIIALITVASLIIAIAALSMAYIRLYPTTTPQPTVTPIASPTATPNLSSAIPDTANYISINVTAINYGFFPHQYNPNYYVHITNNHTSPITVLSIIGTANDNINFTYWTGNQVIAPNTTSDFTGNDTITSGWPMNDIYVYYELSGQLFVHSLTPAPIPIAPTPSPTSNNP
jgi:hypothetical protein